MRRIILLFFVLVVTMGRTATPEQWKIPQPGPEVRKLGFLIGKWKNHYEGKPGAPNPVKTVDATFECNWISDGYLVACPESGVLNGKQWKELDTFGYSAGAKLYSMVNVVTDDQGMPEVETAWFSIDGNRLRFPPSEMKVGDKVFQMRGTWEIKTPDLRITRIEYSEDGVHWLESGQGEHRRVQ